MSWNEARTSIPERSEDQLRQLVSAKAEDIRWRRRWGFLGGLSAVVLVLGGWLVVAGATGGPATRVDTGSLASGPATTVAATGPGTGTGTGTTVDPGPALEPAPAAPLPLPSETTTPDAAATPAAEVTTVPAAGGYPPPPATTTTLAPRPPACVPGQVSVTASVDRPVYTASQSVRIGFTARNRSARTCVLADPSVEVRDGAGKVVFNEAVADLFTFSVDGVPPHGQVAPGEERTGGFEWSPAGCSPDPCGKGTYSAVVSLGGPPPAGAASDPATIEVV